MVKFLGRSWFAAGDGSSDPSPAITSDLSRPDVPVSVDGHETWDALTVIDAREASENTNYGRSFMRIMEYSVVGTGRTRIRVNHPYTQAKWDMFTMNPTLRGWDMESLLRVVLFSNLTDGDFFGEWGWHGRDNRWGIYPRDALLVGEGMRLGGYLGTLGGEIELGLPGDNIVDGVELDRDTREPLAYFLNLRKGMTRIPAQDMLHTFYRTNINQVRGRPVIRQGIKALEDVDKYRGFVMDDARKRSALSLIFKVKSSLVNTLERIWQRRNPQEAADLNKLVNNYMQRALNMKPGQNLSLDENVDVEWPQGTSVLGRDYEMAHKNLLRDAGAALGPQYATLAGDNSDGNFSSQRLGRLHDIGFFRIYQGVMRQFMIDLYTGWIQREMIRDPRLNINAPFKVMQPGFEGIDPLKEVAAQKIALELGLTTRQFIASESQGRDWAVETYPVLKREAEMMAALGGNDNADDARQPTD